MRHRSWLAPTLAISLAACAAPPQPPVPSTAPARQDLVMPVPDAARAELGLPADGQIYPDGNPYRLLQVEELPIVGVTVDSEVSSFPAARLADGDLSTEWVNGGYRNATSWAAVELAESASIASVGIKTGPTAAGASYDLQVSEDGSTWTTVSSNLTNTTWGLENKPLPGGSSGKYVRIFWRNSASNPQPHFSIFELVVNGEAGVVISPSPTPTPTPTPTPSATPTPAPSSSPTPTPPPPSGEVVRLTPSSVSASSTYAGLVPGRAIDGSLSTQWANGGYRESEAALTLRFDRAIAFDRVRIKTGALPSGVWYRLETSSDGSTWTDVSGNLTNTTWQMETKDIGGTGEYLRVQFFNSPTNPIARFSTFEIEAYGAVAAENAPPTMSDFMQFPMKIEDRASGTLEVTVADPENDAVRVTWSAEKGTVIGVGTSVTYQAPNLGPSELDDIVTVVAEDDSGNRTTRQFEVDTYVGSEVELQAADALEWDPAKAAYAQLFGDVTVFAGGDFSVYNAVIAEYTTNEGRKLALLPPGETTLPGVTGNVFMYLLGPTGEFVPQPSINLTLSGGGQTVNRAITAANVAADYGQGYEPSLGPGDAGHSVGRSTAKNGAFFYNSLLEIRGFGAYTVPDPEAEPSGEITYVLHGPGSFVWGLDRRICPHDCVNRLVLTDSLGGTGDNTGFWRVFDMVFDD